jgi:hypothetical protein
MGKRLIVAALLICFFTVLELGGVSYSSAQTQMPAEDSGPKPKPTVSKNPVLRYTPKKSATANPLPLMPSEDPGSPSEPKKPTVYAEPKMAHEDSGSTAITAIGSTSKPKKPIVYAEPKMAHEDSGSTAITAIGSTSKPKEPKTAPVMGIEDPGSTSEPKKTAASSSDLKKKKAPRVMVPEDPGPPDNSPIKKPSQL